MLKINVSVSGVDGSTHAHLQTERAADAEAFLVQHDREGSDVEAVVTAPQEDAYLLLSLLQENLLRFPTRE